MSVLITPEWPYCSYPLLVEVYHLCYFNCLYCFTRHKESWHNKASKRRERGFSENKDLLNVECFNKIFDGYSKLNKKEQEIKKFIDRRLAIQIGGQTEPAGNLELKYQRTKKLLEILKYKGKNYPVRISVKGTAFLGNEYIRIFEGYNTAYILVSIISANEKIMKKIEPNAPSVKERLQLANVLSKTGANLGLRLRPIIPIITKNTVEELFHKAKESGIKWVTVEWLRIPRTMTRPTAENYNKLSKIIGFDIVDYYKRYNDVQNNKCNILRLKREATVTLYQKIIKLGKQMGLRIASCNKDYRCFKTFTPNCCGIPLADSHWSRMQLSYAVYLAKKNGKVFLHELIDKDSPLFNIKNKDNDTKRYSELSYGESLVRIWNNSEHRYYPSNFFPELKYVEKDRNGNHIFSYNKI